MVNQPDSKKDAQQVPVKASALRRIRRSGLRIVGRLMLALLVIVLMLLVVLVFPVTRSGLLKFALGQAHRFLPGELTVREASWPELGRLKLDGVVWRVAFGDSLKGAAVGDTLALVSHLEADLDLQALRQKDLWLNEITLAAGPVDVPTIIKLFPVQESASEAPETEAPGSFLRKGSLAPAPSVGLQRFTIQIKDILVNESLTLVQANLEGLVDLRFEHEPALQLENGNAWIELNQDEPMVLKADSLSMALKANGADRDFILENLSVRVPEAGPSAVRSSWRAAETVFLRINGEGQWTDTGLSVALAGVGALPGPEHLRPLLPEEFPLEVSGPVSGDFDLNVVVDDLAQPEPIASVRVDFSETTWLEHFVLDAGIENGTVDVKKLDLIFMGAELSMAGWADSTEVEMTLAAALTDPALLRMFGGQSMANAEASLEMTADMKGSWPVPDLDMEFTAAGVLPDLQLPSLHTEIHSRNSVVDMKILLDQGLTAGSVVVDSLQVNWEGNLSQPDSLSHRFDLAAWLPMGNVAMGGSGLIDSVRTLQLDSLVIASMDSTMRILQPAIVTLGPGPRDLTIEEFHLGGGLGFVDLHCENDSTGLLLDIETDLLLREDFLMAVSPSEFWSKNGGSDVSIKAKVDLMGGGDGPVFTGAAGARILSHRDNPAMGVDLDFHLESGDSSGLGADLKLFTGDISLLKGSLRWPGHPDLDTGQWVPEPGRGLVVRFPEQNLDMALLNSVLPPDIELEGLVEFNAQLVEKNSVNTSEFKEPGDAFLAKALIDGHVGLQKLNVKLPNRSRLALSMDTDLLGSVSDPEIKGKVIVTSGYFRIPEMPPVLLPVEGESLLWQAMVDQARAEGDTIEVDEFLNPKDQGPMLGGSSAPIIPNLDVTLEIPGNLIINGYGLNIELEGSLQATRGQDEDGIPAVVLDGSIGVPTGTLKFMNNIFSVEKADIQFNQAAPPKPHLDVKLTADVSGYQIILEVTGFADNPKVELSSKPEMANADIIAVLLFGQPANDLDNSQRGEANKENDPGAQLKDNLAALAVVFGGAGLQNKMSNTLGVDMVEMGSDSQGDNTIMAGKFLTPKILLKYNQSLEKSGTYFVTLEYAVSRYMKFISTYGQGEEASGVEAKWSRRY